MSEKKKRTGSSLFKPGQSGNPNGRPKGAKNRSTIICEAIEGKLVTQLEKDASAILQKTIELAKEGDTTCIKILMDRLLPARRASEDNDRSKGTGGINIIVQNLNDKETTTTIDGEIVDAEVQK